MGDLRAEIWARPGASTFERIYADALIGRFNGTVRANGIGDGSFEFPDFDGAEALADLLLRVDDNDLGNAKRALIRVYHDGQESGVDPPVHEWMVDAVVPPGVDNNPRWQVTGEDGLEWLNHASVYPWDWDGSAAFQSDFPDHIWGGRNVLGELRCTYEPEVVTLTGTNIDAGTFTIAVSTDDGVDTTAAIDYDATSLSVYNALLALSVVDALEVDGEPGGPWTVSFQEPSNQGWAVSTNNGNLAGTWSLVIDATGGTYDLTVENPDTTTDTATLNFDDDAPTVETAIEALTTVTAATVTGTPSGGFTITFETPDFSPSLTTDATSLTGGASTATATENTASVVVAVQSQGGASPVGWVSSEFSPTDMPHGTLQSLRCWSDSGFDPALPSCATTAGVFNGAELYFPGVEKPVRVQPGGIYQASVWVYARDTDTDIRLVLRDVADNAAGTNYTTEQTVTADTWTELTITDFRPFDHVDEVKFRIGHVGAEGIDPPIIYWACPTLQEGQAPTSIGGVWISLFDDAHTDHVADGRIVWEDEANPGTPWLTVDFTAAVDSAGVAWDTSDVELTAKRGWSYARVLRETMNLGYEARVVPDPVTDGAWLFQLYNPGGMDADYTDDAFVGVRSGVDVTRRQTKRFRPGGTAQTVEGAERQFAFSVNTTAETALGRMERYLPDRDINGSTEVATAAASLLAEGLKRAISKTLTVAPGPDDPVPLVNYVPGDTIPVVDPPDADTNLRVAAINYVATPDTGVTYEVSMASERAVGRAAIRAGVIQYLREQKEIREEPPNDNTSSPYLLRSVASIQSTPGQPTYIDSTGGQFINEGTTLDLSLPTSADGDRIYIFIRTLGTDRLVTGPTGFTLASASSGPAAWLYYLDVVGAGPTSAQITTEVGGLNDEQVAYVAVTVRNPTTDTVSSWYEASSSNVNDPPQVAPTSAPGEHLILSFLGHTTGDTSQHTGSTGYTIAETIGAGSSEPLAFFQYALIDVSTVEDPDSWLYPADGIGNGILMVTVAVAGTAEESDHFHVESDVSDISTLTAKATPVAADQLKIYDSEDSDTYKRVTIGDLPGGGGALDDLTDVTIDGTPADNEVVAYDSGTSEFINQTAAEAGLAAASHTHTESDVTDLDHWTETDHDALDHTGLTGVGESDHGGLSGLADDDHPQYLLAAGTRAATFLEVSGLAGATGASPRFVGGTTTGAPVSGTFQLGDFVVTEDGGIYVCTTAGSPGTWTEVGAGAATDADAIHDNVAGEIAALDLVSAASGDHVLIEDASDSNNKKRVAASDFLGGGGGSTVPEWMERLASPDSAHTDDDEFDDNTLGGTAVTPSGTATWTEDHGLLSLKMSGQSSGDQCARLYPMTTTTAPITIQTVPRMLAIYSDAPMFGLVFADGTTAASNAVSFGFYLTNTTTMVLARWAGTLTSMSTSNIQSGGAFADIAFPAMNSPLYMRMIWTAANTWAWALSPDGISWTDFSLSTFAATLTPTHYGVFGSNWSSAVPSIVTFEHFRVVEADLSV